MKKILVLATMILLAASLSFAQTWGPTGQSTVQVSIGPEASISITNGTTTVNLTEGSGAFANFTGETDFSYKVRTTKSGGSGQITVLFSGPLSDGTDSISLTNLSYTCAGGSPATPCTGSVTASSSTPTNVDTFSADAHSANAGTAGSVSWTLANLPQYETGNTYRAVATFSISAL